MIVRCEEPGEAWKHTHRHTMNWMPGRVTVRYRSEPIMLLYSLWSIASPFSSGSSAVAVLIDVNIGLSSAMLSFFIRSFVYLAWCTNVPCFICLTWIPKKMLVLSSWTSRTPWSFLENLRQAHEKSHQRWYQPCKSDQVKSHWHI
jgi:hypothetical protein